MAVHQVDYVGYCLGIVGGIAVDFHIEYMSAAGELVVRGLDLGLVAGRAVVVNGHVVGVCVIRLVGDAGDDAE